MIMKDDRKIVDVAIVIRNRLGICLDELRKAMNTPS